MSDLPSQRLLLVHAHPDDETIATGATMAQYAAEGRGVTLVTCTGGEMGEILVPDLVHLAADQDDGLAEHRRGELDEAMRILGVTDHRFLGGFGCYRDSGMKWHEDGHAVPADDLHANAFWHADLAEAATHLVEVIREVRPQVLVTYDQFGNYGHPDHIQAHRVAMRAADLAAEAGLGIEKVYWNCIPRSEVEAGFERLRASGSEVPFEGVASPDDLPMVVADSVVTAVIDKQGAYAGQKTAAMKAHASQIAVDGFFFALSNDLGQPLFGAEYYQLVRGTAGDARLEEDLFAGVAEVGTP
jgi:N-acetyl-1-D-myo-inositol-2-amino-2-deoxy-alpha-D-glucopyranoside deacetylase